MNYSRLVGFAILLASCAWAADFQSNWPKDLERPWVGPEYWSNPLQDWRLRGGRLECIAAGGDRNVYLLTRDVSAAPGTLSMSVRLGRIEEDRAASGPGFAGFRLGIRGMFKDYRDSAVRGYGMNAGLSANGRLFIARQADSTARVRPPFMDLELRLAAEPAGSAYRVVLQAFDGAGKCWPRRAAKSRPTGSPGALPWSRVPGRWKTRRRPRKRPWTPTLPRSAERSAAATFDFGFATGRSRARRS